MSLLPATGLPVWFGGQLVEVEKRYSERGGGWRAYCCLGRALAFFFFPITLHCCLAWGGGPGVESWEERSTH